MDFLISDLILKLKNNKNDLKKKVTIKTEV